MAAAALGLLRGVGADNGDGVAVLKDLLIAQDGPVPAVAQVGGEGDQPGDAVLALDVLVGHHLEDPLHLFRLGGVDGEDVGVGHVGLDQGQVERFAGQLQPQVGAVVQGPGDLGQGRRPGVGAAPDLAVFGQLVGQLAHGQFAAQNLGRVHDRVHQWTVTGAAAGVAVGLVPVADLLPGGGEVLVQEGLGGDDEAGGAEAALGRAVDHPGHLQGVEIVRGAHPLDGGDGGSFGQLGHLGHAGADQLAVQNNVATAALSFIATHLGPGETQLLAQNMGQGLVRGGHHGLFLAVDLQSFLNHVNSPPFSSGSLVPRSRLPDRARSLAAARLGTLSGALVGPGCPGRTDQGNTFRFP